MMVTRFSVLVIFLCAMTTPGVCFTFNSDDSVNQEEHVSYQNYHHQIHWASCGNNSMCQCRKKYARCLNHGQDLDYIPSFKRTIEKLNFTGNYLPEINNNTFENITKFRMKYLGIESCSLQSCSSNAFTKLDYLDKLIISHENISISELMKCLSSVTKGLFSLGLRNLNLNPLPPDFFIPMQDSKMLKLNMDDTNIEVYNQRVFRPLKHLRDIFVSRSNIHTVNLEYSPNIEWFSVVYNKIVEFPRFCVNGTSLFPKLSALIFDHNFIRHINRRQLKCLTSLTNLSISDNPIVSFESNLFSDLSVLHYLFFEYNSAQSIQVQSYAFNSSSLRQLYFSNNKILFDGNHLSLNAFKYCEQLQTLFVSTNNLISTTDEMFDELFSTLKNLKTLSLGNTRITFVPRVISNHMRNLETLYLDHNHITGFQDGVFSSLGSLKKLDLSSNQISVINQNSFSLEWLNTLQWIDLSNNSYTCSCELLWFINFLKSQKLRKPFKNDQYYTCNSPKECLGKQIVKSPISGHKCAFSRLVLTSATYCSVALILLLLTISGIYRFRWHLRYMVYMARFHQKRYQNRLHGHQQYQHDIYLSCEDNDFDIILDDIVPKLERDMGLRLYIPLRDGQGNKIDSIINNMDASRKVILCLSDNYARDSYCEFEASLAYDKYITERRDLMIVIVLRELSALNVTKTFHKILNVDNYIKWGWNDEGIELFWLKLTQSVRNLDDMIP
ncbi:toll-like receptor 2 [Patella vulgata]|uniref:toll-like receptor 2 n=1 Tax=Patella vulgata TaxID=6465 RepID=UPI00218025AC|nr:toll-like receptor 2 [Patella vulgata]